MSNGCPQVKVGYHLFQNIFGINGPKMGPIQHLISQVDFLVAHVGGSSFLPFSLLSKKREEEGKEGKKKVERAKEQQEEGT